MRSSLIPVETASGDHQIPSEAAKVDAFGQLEFFGRRFQMPIAGALFWCPVMIGAGLGFRQARPERVLVGFTWVDSILAILAIIMIRVLGRGIRLAH